MKRFLFCLLLVSSAINAMEKETITLLGDVNSNYEAFNTLVTIARQEFDSIESDQSGSEEDITLEKIDTDSSKRTIDEIDEFKEIEYQPKKRQKSSNIGGASINRFEICFKELSGGKTWKCLLCLNKDITYKTKKIITGRMHLLKKHPITQEETFLKEAHRKNSIDEKKTYFCCGKEFDSINALRSHENRAASHKKKRRINF